MKIIAQIIPYLLIFLSCNPKDSVSDKILCEDILHRDSLYYSVKFTEKLKQDVFRAIAKVPVAITIGKSVNNDTLVESMRGCYIQNKALCVFNINSKSYIIKIRCDGKKPRCTILMNNKEYEYKSDGCRHQGYIKLLRLLNKDYFMIHHNHTSKIHTLNHFSIIDKSMRLVYDFYFIFNVPAEIPIESFQDYDGDGYLDFAIMRKMYSDSIKYGYTFYTLKSGTPKEIANFPYQGAYIHYYDKYFPVLRLK